MKLSLLLALSLAVLLQTVYNQEDLTDEEVAKEEPTTGSPQQQQGGEPTPPPFEPPAKPIGDVYFAEAFTDAKDVWNTWASSKAVKDGGEAKYDGQWELSSPSTEGGLEEDQGLLMPDAAKHYAIAAKMERTFDFSTAEAFVMQYEVNFQNGLSCGGAYVKLLASADNLDMFEDKTPYSIMFGPDKCGATSKIHFIVQFKNPVTGEVEEKHSKQSTSSMEFFNDKKTHLFTLLIRSDGVYHILVDQIPFLKGDILEDLTPPILPSKEIDDPEDKMPEDWDEREKIPDPDAVKPEDWDEDAPPKIPDPDAVKPEGWLDDGPEYIEDPDATIPEDWDEEEDGEYEAPMITNPACEEVGCGAWKPPMIQNPSFKGKWKPPLIENPNYSGKWAPRKIDNPAYFEDDHPFSSFSSISAIGFELWTMSEDILIDNIIVCGELAIANNFARDGWILKMQSERAVGGAMSLGSWLDSFVELANTYPYLWALYAVAIVLPFVCCIGCCCIKSKPDEAARRKKTDEPTPDDPKPEDRQDSAEPKEESFIAAADEEEAEQSQGEESGGGSQGEEEGGTGSQGEGSQGEGSQAEDGAEGAGTGSQAEDGAESQGEQEVAEEKEKAPTESTVSSTPPKKSSSRRRKNRRED